MVPRPTVLLSLLILTAWPSVSRSQPMPTDALAVVADATTLERAVVDAPMVFEVDVVFTNPVSGLGSVAAIEFGIDMDPGLSLLGRNSNGLILEPAPLEYAIAFPKCLGAAGPEPFAVLTLIVLRTGDALPGAGIRVRGPNGGQSPITATRCANGAAFEVRNFGGVVVDPDAPTVVAMMVEPTVAIEGREYAVHWETVGGGSWTLDGEPVAGRGSVHHTAITSTEHRLEEAGGASEVRQVQVAREPFVAAFDAQPGGAAGTFAVHWQVHGAYSTEISGLGGVDQIGTATVDSGDWPILELRSTNEWGTRYAVLELVAPTGPPVIEQFSSNPEEYHYNQTVWLHYQVSGATELRIEPEHGRVPLGTGDVPTRVTTTVTHTLIATNAHGAVSAEVVLEPPLPLISRFLTIPQIVDWIGVGPGTPLSLDYSTLGADSVWIDPGFENLPPEGQIDILVPPVQQLYTIYASNAIGVVNRTLLIEASPPRILLTVYPRFVPGFPVTLKWSASWADELWLMPDSIPLIPRTSGEIELHPTEPLDYAVHGTNSAGETVRTFRVDFDRPWVRDFRFDPVPGIVGQEFEVYWDVVGADEIEVRGAPGLGSLAPDIVDTVRTTYAYPEPFKGYPVLVARNSQGERELRLSKYVNVLDDRDFIEYFNAENPTPEAGTRTYIRWNGRSEPRYRLEPDGIDVYRYGTRWVTPHPGTNAWVLEATHASTVETDTAWIVVDPIATFTLDKAQSIFGDPIEYFPGEDITVTWSTPGAQRVTISPGIGDVQTEGGELHTSIEKSTEFVLSAWINGEREVHERRVVVSRPRIDSFEFHPELVRPDESTTLSWSVAGATEVYLYLPPYYEPLPVGAVDSLRMDTPLYGTSSLRAQNSGGDRFANARLLAPYPEVESFTATPPAIVAGEPVTLSWDVSEVSEVKIDGLGGFGPTGQIVVYPEESRGYVLTGIGPTNSVSRVAAVRVDVDASHPATIMVSGSREVFTDTVDPVDPDAPEGELRYVAWVRVENLLGSISAIWFALDVPDWLQVEEVVDHYYGSPSTDIENAHKVSVNAYASDEPFSDWISRVELRQVAPAPPGAIRSLRVHPGPGPGAAPGARPIAPSWYWYGAPAEFGFTLPGMSPAISEPLELRGLEVPVRVLPLASEWTPFGLQLSWSGLPEVAFDELRLLRGDAPGHLAPARVVTGTSAWVDPDAARLYDEGPLYYRLVGRTPDSGSWSSPELRIEAAPPTPAIVRTRLLAPRPNPFNPRTTIAWELARPGAVRITIHDLAGRRIRAWSLEEQPAGQGSVAWDGVDDRGRRAASGVYVVRMEADGRVDARRVTLLK